MVLHLVLGGDPERPQRACCGLAKRGGLRWNRTQRLAEPWIRQGPAASPSRTPCGHDAPLEPEQRQGISDQASLSPTGFVLLGMFFKIGGAHRTIGREALEDRLDEAGATRHPVLRRPWV